MISIKQLAKTIIGESGVALGIAIVMGLSAVGVGLIFVISSLTGQPFAEVLAKVLSIFGVQ